MFENPEIKINRIQGDKEMWKDRLFSVINTFDMETESFVSFRLTNTEKGRTNNIETIMNVNPRDLPALIKSFKESTGAYIKAIAEKDPMLAAKVMANIMVQEQMSDDEDDEDEGYCTCGHCDA